MSGTVDLGHDGDAVIGGVGDQFDELALRPVAGAPVLCRGPVAGPRGLVADGAGLDRELRVVGRIAIRTPVIGDLDAEALVLAQVQVQRVHLVGRHHVDHLLYLIERVEGTRRVDQHAAPLVTRGVGDVDGRDESDIGKLHRGVRPRTDQLQQRLRRPYARGGAAGLDGDRVGVGDDRVGLIGGDRLGGTDVTGDVQVLVKGEGDRAVRAFGEFQAVRGAELVTHDVNRRQEAAVAHGHAGVLLKFKRLSVSGLRI